MPLTVLSEVDITSILSTLKREDVVQLQENLGEALHDYSTGTLQTTQTCSKNQPKRFMIPAANNHTTLFMPAVTNTSRGIKVVSVATVDACPASVASAATSLSSLSLNKSTSQRSQSPAPSQTSNKSVSTAATTAPSSLSTTAASNDIANTTPYGALTLLTPSGAPYAFLSIEELTAFRTALASTLLLLKRTHVHTITVFGAGAQARWHIRLAILLRGHDIHHIDLVNRSFKRATQIMHDFHHHPQWQTVRDAANPKLKFSATSTDYKDYPAQSKDLVRRADVLFLCTPATEPLFPHEHLTNSDGRKKGRLIVCIGSYRPHMCELHPEILKQAVGATEKEREEAASKAQGHTHVHLPHIHHSKHAHEGGVVVVDSLDACLREAGEIIQANVRPEQLVEVGELLMIKKASRREIELGLGEGEKGLRKWIMGGNVIYKSVGLGVMDICVGEDLVQLAREKGVGTFVPGF